MIVSLYAGLSEFALPAPAKKEGEEERHEAKGSSKSLFERLTAESDRGKPAAHDGDAAVIADKARWTALTADVPVSGPSNNLAGGNLTDGYQLHDFCVDNAGAQDQSFQGFQTFRSFQNSSMPEVASANTSNNTAAGILPNFDLDYSSEGAAAQSVGSSANSGRSTAF